MRRNNHQYKVGDKILVNRRKKSKHKSELMGPFHITQINDNITVRFQKGIINDATNIRRIKPFFDLNILTIKIFFTTLLFLFKQKTTTQVIKGFYDMVIFLTKKSFKKKLFLF